MGKGLGVATLIVAVIAVVIPIYGIYLGVITALLGIVVAWLKEQQLAVAIGVLNVLNAIFLTPSLDFAISGAKASGQMSRVLVFRGIFWFWVASGLAAIIVSAATSRSNQQATSTTRTPPTAT